VQVLGAAIVRGQQQGAGTAAGTDTDSAAAARAPALVRTGGVALGGLALWLLISGLVIRLAGSTRLWGLRRPRG
jgi:hypothetical protein